MRMNSESYMTKNFKKQKNTHLVFDGEKIIISPNIGPVVDFLMEIEREISNLMCFQEKLEKIRIQYLEILKLAEFLAKKLKDSNIDFQYHLKEDVSLIGKNLIFDLPVRSQMIVLFANLEVLFSLHIAYEKEIDDENQMRDISMKDKDFLRKFINSFLLTDENKYYKDNKLRLSKIDSRKIRDLRNSLTHFFSLPSCGLSIAPKWADEKTRKLENFLNQNGGGHIVFISPEDLQGLIKSAYMLRIIRWNDDFYVDKIEFGKKFNFVINLVEKYGAVSILGEQLNI